MQNLHILQTKKRICQISVESPGVSARIDVMMRSGPEMLQYRPTLMGMG
jgi:hypothetical protein